VPSQKKIDAIHTTLYISDLFRLSLSFASLPILIQDPIFFSIFGTWTMFSDLLEHYSYERGNKQGPAFNLLG